jgi:hypothetical protein
MRIGFGPPRPGGQTEIYNSFKHLSPLGLKEDQMERSLKEDQMERTDTVVAIFADHQGAETAVKKLAEGGIDVKHLSLIGKGYHSDEKVVGFYNAGDRIKFWGERGAFWGGLWGWFFGTSLLSSSPRSRAPSWSAA